MLASLLTKFKNTRVPQPEPAVERVKANIHLYSTKFCPYCVRARMLLDSKQVEYEDIAVDGKPELRQQMIAESGAYTVPQIWIGEQHIGGCDELYQLERQNKLDEMIAAANVAPSVKEKIDE